MVALGIAFGVGLMPASSAAALDKGAPPAPPMNARVATDAHHVAVGFYGVTIQGLDVRDNSFYADFFMWMRWRGQVDPTKTMEFTNNIDRWAITKAAVYEQPNSLPSGEFVQIFRVQGRFFQPLDLRRYPIDNQQLTVTVEDTTRTVDDLNYVPDSTETSVDPALVQPGWTVRRATVHVTHH